MDKKIRISIMIGESRYPLWIDPKEEPIFREAGRMVNRRLIAYRTRFHDAGLNSEDMLAMAALDLAATLQQKEQDASSPAATEAALADIVADLQDFMAPDGAEAPAAAPKEQ